MKRGFSDSPSSSSAKKVADHYSRRRNQTLEEREASPIIHLKKLNNWIKSVLIQLYTRPDDSVLDLACGKGGDLNKWDKAQIGYYVGIDIAQGSIQDCRTRFDGKKLSFPSRLLCADCFEVELDKVLQEDAPFDICSCQFAMHYSWSTEARARRALANVSALLRPGEYSQKKFKTSSPFGIEYMFHLEDAVDCPEWIVPFNVFNSLAQEYDLELVFVKNSHEFVHEYMKKPEFVQLMTTLGALGDQSTLSADEWEAAYLYLSFVLRKRGESDEAQRKGRRKNGKMNLSIEGCC
ncbi:hypothetical protein AALP_AA4G144400 [Arabis alpina]|uniref:mRNA (guanine-N(7))-methyltransferase n=1 Tax=Arabis alpina TaxID=50452 RepID=A0A087H395_ARAAL|nr:hypothetical protein AALP_AA4G144400 [Arabis alpina]